MNGRKVIETISSSGATRERSVTTTGRRKSAAERTANGRMKRKKQKQQQQTKQSRGDYYAWQCFLFLACFPVFFHESDNYIYIRKSTQISNSVAQRLRLWSNSRSVGSESKGGTTRRGSTQRRRDVVAGVICVVCCYYVVCV